MNLTRLTYTTLRRAYRVAANSLLANENSFAMARQALHDARGLCNRWDVGFCKPDFAPNSPWLSGQWQTKGNRRVLFVSRSLSNWLKTA